jgi:hypothetical protein
MIYCKFEFEKDSCIRAMFKWTVTVGQLYMNSITIWSLIFLSFVGLHLVTLKAAGILATSFN